MEELKDDADELEEAQTTQVSRLVRISMGRSLEGWTRIRCAHESCPDMRCFFASDVCF